MAVGDKIEQKGETPFSISRELRVNHAVLALYRGEKTSVAKKQIITITVSRNRFERDLESERIE